MAVGSHGCTLTKGSVVMKVWTRIGVLSTIIITSLMFSIATAVANISGRADGMPIIVPVPEPLPVVVNYYKGEFGGYEVEIYECHSGCLSKLAVGLMNKGGTNLYAGLAGYENDGDGKWDQFFYCNYAGSECGRYYLTTSGQVVRMEPEYPGPLMSEGVRISIEKLLDDAMKAVHRGEFIAPIESPLD